ncbi:MAG: hypothetical protein Q8N12_05675 [Thermodesulfovibrionales bacterium]|nr:hypothetical protein [Thermodesulfovibrionales bacterium]
MPKTTFVDGDKSQGIQGSKIFAAFLHKWFGTSGGTGHRHSGLNEDGSAPIDYAPDTGAANAYVITLAPALTARVVGMPIHFMAANANTGASTLNDGLGVCIYKRYIQKPCNKKPCC